MTATSDRLEPPVELVGGIVSWNDGQQLALAVDSLLRQELPSRTRWSEIHVITNAAGAYAIGDPDAQEEGAPLVRVTIEAERRGKSAAVGDVLREARADYVILLNGDALARPGAVKALLERAGPPPGSGPVAIMARPVPPELGPHPVSDAIRILWNLHDASHLRNLSSGGGTHLSDELLLVSGNPGPQIPPGIVNDGAYLAQTVARDGGRVDYARDALVEIAVPATLAGHLRQRRRILWGHRQVGRLFGRSPATFTQLLLRQPAVGVRLLRAELTGRLTKLFGLSLLVLGELWASVLVRWDDLPRKRSHAVWTRVVSSVGAQPDV